MHAWLTPPTSITVLFGSEQKSKFVSQINKVLFLYVTPGQALYGIVQLEQSKRKNVESHANCLSIY